MGDCIGTGEAAQRCHRSGILDMRPGRFLAADTFLVGVSHRSGSSDTATEILGTALEFFGTAPGIVVPESSDTALGIVRGIATARRWR